MIQRSIELAGSDIRVTFVREEELQGSGGTIYNNREFVRREHAFYVIYADVWTSLSLKTLLNFHRRRSGIMTMALYVPLNPTECGIAKVDKGTVVAFEEKPKATNGKCFAFTGVAVAHPASLALVSPRSDVGRDWIPQLVGKINSFVVKEDVIDIGTPDGYDRARKRVQELGLKAL